MSSVGDHQILQRLIVRLLHDPDLTRAIYESPQEHLTPMGLSREAQSWLLSVDQRRWTLDAERAHRSLEGVIVHCPVTTALFVSAWSEVAQASLDPALALKLGSVTSGGEALLSFFKSELFHRCISARGYLADAFMDWVEVQLSALLKQASRGGERRAQRGARRGDQRHAHRALKRGIRFAITQLRLERAVIAQRRVPHRASPHRASPHRASPHRASLNPLSPLSLPNTHRLITAPAGSVDVYSALYQATAELMSAEGDRGGQAALLRPHFKLCELGERLYRASVDQEDEVALIESNAEGASIESLSSGLAQVLTLASQECSADEIIALLERSEMSHSEAITLLSGWLESGLITALPSARPDQGS